MNRRIAAFFFLLLGTANFLPAQMLGKTVATVNLTKTVGITESQVEQRYEELKSLGAQGGLPSGSITREKAIESLIMDIVIKQAAERDGVTVQEEDLQKLIDQQKRQLEVQAGRSLSQQEFQSLVQQQSGMKWEDYREQLKNQLLQQTYITRMKRDLFQDIDPPTEEEISWQYRHNATSFTNPEFVRISHVFVRTVNKTRAEQEEGRKKIQEALSRLKSGEMSFDDLVLKYSEDENSKFRGGDVGFVTINNQQVLSAYGMNFFKEIFKLEKGDVSDIIESNVGYHIVKITDHREATILKLDDRIAPDNMTTIREYLRNRLYQEKQQSTLQKATQEVMDELLAQTEVIRYD